jgi:signal-transduction protein with cAMP-binding, CBS, and nucleotidyltransferase domain
MEGKVMKNLAIQSTVDAYSHLSDKERRELIHEALVINKFKNHVKKAFESNGKIGNNN